MITLGIDLSLTSPALCIHQGQEFKFTNCKFHYLTSIRKALLTTDIIIGTEYPEYSSSMERYNLISDWIISNIKHYKVTSVMLEDYAFGATGRVFNIAENTGILKHKLWNLGVPTSTVPPTVVKKFATGKGNANKEKLDEEFVKETGLNLKTQLQLTSKQWNPSSDIVDSYYICKYGVFYGQKK